MRCRDKLRVGDGGADAISTVTKRSRVQTPDECHQPLATTRLRMLIVVLRVIVFTLSSELEPGQ